MHRVVVTGMGVCAPGAIGLQELDALLAQGESGIQFIDELKNLNFSCQVAGRPSVAHIDLNKYFSNVELRGLNANGLVYGIMAGLDAWSDAGLALHTNTASDFKSGVIFGTGILGVDKFREAIYKVDAGDVRRLGSTAVIQTMASGISAFLAGKIGAGNQVTTNSSACATGTEAILMGYERIKQGKAQRMLVGSCSDSGPYVWGGFDAMRILPRKFNTIPKKASRPMSATAAGFVPGSGAGGLVLESLENAQARGAHIYAEVLGGHVNSGGQRQGGTMTAPNSAAVRQCIVTALNDTGIDPTEVDVINGHLTATTKDVVELENWSRALGLEGEEFPYINSFKGHFGHCLAAAGSIESIGAILQLHHQKIYGTINCEDLHPDIEKWVAPTKIPQKTLSVAPKKVVKASFGFGDVNACIIFGSLTD